MWPPVLELLSSCPRRHGPKDIAEDGETFDYIIVGGGNAGCLLANRLTADASKRVLVLEAGRSDFKWPFIRIPAGVLHLFKSAYDWAFESTKELYAAGRQIYLCRGKVLGGSSCVNVMLYTRGTREDYDQWQVKGWSGDEVLQYFKKAENSHRGADAHHNVNGEWSTCEVPYQNPLSRLFLAACEQFGSPANNDFNDWSKPQVGHGRYDVCMQGGVRVDAATAFLEPCLDRKNLTVSTGALVRRLLFDGTRTTGVEYSLGGGTSRKANLAPTGEVILAAGACASPQILMLSGIGPKDELTKHGIPTFVDLPGVGKNFQDHPAAVVSYECTPAGKGVSVTSEIRIPGTKITNPFAVFKWLFSGSGPLASVGCDHGGFFKTNAALPDGQPDLQVRFLAARALAADGMATYSNFRNTLNPKDGFTFQSIAVRPQSRGELTLRSSDPADAPLITTNFLKDPEDRKTIREGLRLSRRIVHETDALKPFLDKEVYPGEHVKSDDDLDAYIASSVHTGNAIVGTCKMGGPDDKFAVVDQNLHVKGVEGLRVCDASVMPTLPGGQSGAATVMIAEKASDLILGKPVAAEGDGKGADAADSLRRRAGANRA